MAAGVGMPQRHQHVNDLAPFYHHCSPLPLDPDDLAPAPLGHILGHCRLHLRCLDVEDCNLFMEFIAQGIGLGPVGITGRVHSRASTGARLQTYGRDLTSECPAEI